MTFPALSQSYIPNRKSLIAKDIRAMGHRMTAERYASLGVSFSTAYYLIFGRDPTRT